jgi:hypothetical protein
VEEVIEVASQPAIIEKLDDNRNLLEEALGGLLTPEESPELAPQSSGEISPSVPRGSPELETISESSGSGEVALEDSQSHTVADSELEDEEGPPGVDTGGEGGSEATGAQDAHQGPASQGAEAQEQAGRGGASRRGRRRRHIYPPASRSSNRLQTRPNP